ncbi:MAG TPA: aldo/keto reductase [Steroidobacteraceae bacterium]|nr:aldo/keto reductase [Steroidobacteraceae bacterium]
MRKSDQPGVTRRRFLAAGAASGVGALLSRTAHSRDPQRPGSRELTAPAAGISAPTLSAPTATVRLIAKAIPATGEWLPAIGIGTDSFRNALREEIRAELKRMHELGGAVIDTAAAYGDSEALIGEALESLAIRDKMFLATKLVGSSPFEPAGGESLARSLERLKTGRVDLLQVHNLNGVAALIPQLQEWKRSGRIRYLGVTTSRRGQHAQLAEVMRTYRLDFVQVDYSIANREAAEAILPLALEHRIAVLVNLPFGRASLFREAAGRPLPPWAADIDVTSWAQYFLKYVISHPAVTCAIPGSTSIEHLEDNQAAGRGRLPDPDMRRRMEDYWDRKAD